MSLSEADDFLSRVNKLSEAVRGLKDGDLAPEEADKIHEELKSPEVKAQERAVVRELEKEEEWKKGRKGKGMKEDYDMYCMFCGLEFKGEVTECAQCSKELISRAERKELIMAKVNVKVKEKQMREYRRARYKQVEAQKAARKQAGTDYDVWDYYEPDSDSDNEEMIPDNPQMKAMEEDIRKRGAARKVRERKSLASKLVGNKAFARKDFESALVNYSEAITHRKDDKYCYTNRALTNITLMNYTSAVKDCNTAMDIFEFLEDGLKHIRSDANAKFILKLYLRRAAAHRGLKHFGEALLDLQAALLLHPNNAEVKKMLAVVESDMEEKKKAEEIIQESKEAKGAQEGKGEGTEGKESKEKEGASMSGMDEYQQLSAHLLSLKKFNSALSADGAEIVEVVEVDMQAVGRVLAALSALLRGGNKDKNAIYVREKKGMITVVKMMRNLVGEAKQGKETCPRQCLEVLSELCDNEHNKEVGVQLKLIPALLELATRATLDQQTEELVVQVLSLLTEHDTGRAFLSHDLDGVWALVRRALAASNDARRAVQAVGLSLCSNCAFDPKMRQHLRKQIPAAHTLLQPFLGSRDRLRQGRAWAALGNLLNDRSLRAGFAKDSANLSTLVDAMETGATACRNPSDATAAEVLQRVLAAAVNFSVDSPALAEAICLRPTAKKLFGDLIFIAFNPKSSPTLRERAVAVLSRCCRSANDREMITGAGGVEALLAVLSEPVVMRAAKKEADESDVLSPAAHEHATRALALLTSEDTKARAKVLKYKSKSCTGPSLLVKLLSTSSTNKESQIPGNAALAISTIVKDKELAATFRDAIPPLIELMKGDDAKAAKNASIACARLATDGRNLQILRDLRGIEIMASVNRK